ncbi:inhibitor of apoptosis-promoting Bax1-domain-containing protein [Hypoxylon sp. FL1284]|nr:inhibitor of apoptosis-promoting Bax1-domain-containing protein [Hypoxylon sp. FL1284]
MSFTIIMRQGPARLAARVPELAKTSFRSTAPARAFHQSTPKPSSFFTSRTTATSTLLRATPKNAFTKSSRNYMQQTTAPAPDSGSAVRRLLTGGAIFGGTLIAINAVFNRETREDGGMPPFERAYLNSTFLHTGLGVGIIGITARQMIQTGFVYRLMVTNPWVMAIGGLALSFGTMIGTRSIDPDNYVPKYALWTAFNATQAAFVAPLLAFAPPALIARAGLYTVAMMGSISFALFSPAPPVVAVSGLAPLVIPATAARTLAFTENLWLYGGLAVFGGFTLYDVQKILYHSRLAERGIIKKDPINESISLELDFLNIFIRMVQILMMQQNRRK